jgi:hypothetical protein
MPDWVTGTSRDEIRVPQCREPGVNPGLSSQL